MVAAAQAIRPPPARVGAEAAAILIAAAPINVVAAAMTPASGMLHFNLGLIQQRRGVLGLAYVAPARGLVLPQVVSRRRGHLLLRMGAVADGALGPGLGADPTHLRHLRPGVKDAGCVASAWGEDQVGRSQGQGKGSKDAACLHRQVWGRMDGPERQKRHPRMIPSAVHCSAGRGSGGRQAVRVGGQGRAAAAAAQPQAEPPAVS